jgi:hypothetical protein
MTAPNLPALVDHDGRLIGFIVQPDAPGEWRAYCGVCHGRDASRCACERLTGDFTYPHRWVAADDRP